MGRQEIEIDVKAIQPDVRDDSNGDLKSVSSDDALLLSMGKAPELRRCAPIYAPIIFATADIVKSLQFLDTMRLSSDDDVFMVLQCCALLYCFRYWGTNGDGTYFHGDSITPLIDK